MNRDSLTFIEHILQSIEDIESFTKGKNKEKFMREKLVQNAVVRSIEIIGEAVKNLPIQFTVKYPSLEWSKIAAMRDKLIHGYFGVDLEIVWKVVKEELPRLKEQIKGIQEKEKTSQTKTKKDTVYLT